MDRVRPGIEEQADKIAETACDLADTTARSGWTASAADYALVTIDALTFILARINADVRDVLVAVTGATTEVHRLSLPVDAEQETNPPVTAAGRRGLGTGFQGIR